MSIRVKRAKCKFCGAKSQEPCTKKENGKKIPVPFFHHDRHVAAAKAENKRIGMHD